MIIKITTDVISTDGISNIEGAASDTDAADTTIGVVFISLDSGIKDVGGAVIIRNSAISADITKKGGIGES